MNIKDPKLIILIGLLLVSIGLNILLWTANRELIQEQKKIILIPNEIVVPYQKRRIT